MASRNKSATIIAIIAGIFLLIDGVNGFVTWDTIKSFITNYLDNEIIQIIFTILLFIAGLGGISVIAGGLLIGKNKIRLGKFVILLGTGLGLIGFVFSIIVAINNGNFSFNSFLKFGAIGIILSIVARVIVGKDNKKNVKRKENKTL
jgi:hypothetical protein